MSNGKTGAFKYAHAMCFTKKFGSGCVLLQVFDPIPTEPQKRGSFCAQDSCSFVNEFVFWSRCSENVSHMLCI